MNILFLDAYFEPESIAFTHLENDLLNALTKTGYNIYIICPTPTRGIDDTVRKEYKHRYKETLYKGHVHVRRFNAPKEGKNPIIRMFRYLWCNLQTYRYGIKYKNIDVIFANSTPPTQGLLGALVKKRLSKKKNIPFVYCLQDIFPDSLVNAKMTSKGSWIWKLGRKIENYTYKNADEIITISDAFKQNIIKKGADKNKVHVVPNWIDTCEVFPVSRNDNPIFDRYKLDRNKFYICYSGNIGHSQNMNLLLDVAKQIKDEEIRFVVIGDGAAKVEVEKRIEAEKITNVVMLPFQPYEEIANVFSVGDAGLIISKPGIGGSSVPSKTWSIMAAEKPILASFDQDSELAALIKKVGCGIVCPAGEKNSLIKAILKLKSENNTNMGIRGRHYVTNEISKKKCVDKYLKILKV